MYNWLKISQSLPSKPVHVISVLHICKITNMIRGHQEWKL